MKTAARPKSLAAKVKRVTGGIVGTGVVFLMTAAPSSAATPIPTDITCATNESKYLFPVGTFLHRGFPGPVATALTLTVGDRITVTKSLSFDQYVGRVSVTQANEQWALRLGAATTALTPDVPDLLEYADTSGLPTGLGSITAPVSGAVQLVHSSLVQTVDDSPNSVRPVGFCYRLERPYDLTLTKIAGAASLPSGGSVTYQIVVTNVGPGIASGWKVTDLADSGIQITEVAPLVSGSATCSLSPAVCSSSTQLAPGDSVALSVTATVSANQGSVRNFAYVEPPATDLPEIVPLGPIPTTPNDSSTTPTNNDGHADVAVITPVTPAPTTPTTLPTPITTIPAPTSPPVLVPTPSTAPVSTAPAATLPPPTTPPVVAGASTSPGSVVQTVPPTTALEVRGTQVVRTVADTPTDVPTEPDLPFTGTESSSLTALGFSLLAFGVAFLALSRIPLARRRS